MFSCSKSSEPPSPTDELVKHAWINSKRYINKTEQTISICDKDDTLTFGITGTTTIDRGIEKCFTGQPKYESGSYTVIGDQLSITRNGAVTLYRMRKLNEAILDMYELKGTDTYKYEYIPRK
jgi:hypothetical protein